ATRPRRASAPGARRRPGPARPADRRPAPDPTTARAGATRGWTGASSVLRQRGALPCFQCREAGLSFGLLPGAVPGRDLVVGVEGTIGAADELGFLEPEGALVLEEGLPGQVGLEIAEAQHVRREVLRVSVLLDQEAEGLLCRLVAVLQIMAVLDDEPGGRTLEALLLDERQGFVRCVLVLLDHAGPGIELPPERHQLVLDPVAGLRQGGRIREHPRALRPFAPLRREGRFGHGRHLPVQVRRP